MDQKKDFLAWWREAKFGLFIHWGLYSVPGGMYQGRETKGIGEWLMAREQIPLSEYRRYADEFNPTSFNAKEWVALAKQAQMKYIVITAKHHDGFAMYHSQCSKYNIVDATPFGRDPIAELAEECQKEGIRLCFYYSQAQDWEHPDGIGNTWDFDPEKKNFRRYMDEKLLPQLRELLTQYGPIGLIWFDTPKEMTHEESREVREFVKSIQPDCIVSGRIGNALGDYISAGDNMIPNGTVHREWEMPATLNDTWGFKINDHNWKDPASLIRIFVDVAHKGGNYLLNIGPDGKGEIPGPSIDILRKLGDWLRVNGETIFGTVPCPQLPYEFGRWGDVTMGEDKVYMHIYHWPKHRVPLHGLKNEIKRCYLLSDPDKTPLEFRVAKDDDENTCGWVHISIPDEAPDPMDSVIVVETVGMPDFKRLTDDYRFV